MSATEQIVIEDLFGNVTETHEPIDNGEGFSSLIDWYLNETISSTLERVLFSVGFVAVIVVAVLAVITWQHADDRRGFLRYGALFVLSVIIATGSLWNFFHARGQQDAVYEHIAAEFDRQLFERYDIEGFRLGEPGTLSDHNEVSSKELRRMNDPGSYTRVPARVLLDTGATVEYGIKVIDDEVVLYDTQSSGNLPAADELLIN